jgi:hypothetical protein
MENIQRAAERPFKIKDHWKEIPEEESAVTKTKSVVSKELRHESPIGVASLDSGSDVESEDSKTVEEWTLDASQLEDDIEKPEVKSYSEEKLEWKNMKCRLHVQAAYKALQKNPSDIKNNPF